MAVICLSNNCPNQTHQTSHCVSKCCPLGELLDSNHSCVPASKDRQSSELWRHSHPGPGATSYHHNFMTVFRYPVSRGYSRPGCVSVVAMEPNDTYTVLHNNSLHHADYGVTSHYCVDNARDEAGNTAEMVMKCVSEGTEVVRNISYQLVIEENSCIDSYIFTLRLVNTISGVISCIFLIITFLVYVLVPELNNLHGKIVLSNVVSIFFLTSYLVLVYNGSHLMTPTLCKISGCQPTFLFSR